MKRKPLQQSDVIEMWNLKFLDTPPRFDIIQIYKDDELVSGYLAVNFDDINSDDDDDDWIVL